MKALIRAFALAMIVATLMPLIGCNTIRGLGRDVEGAGEKVQEGATEVQEDIK